MSGRGWALGFLGASGAYLALSLTFPLGSVAKPGPGFYPVGVGIFLCLAAATLGASLVQGGQGLGTARAALPAGARARVLTTTAGLIGFCLLLPWVGYPVCAFLFVALVLRALGGGGWAGSVSVAVVSALASYYVFAALLGVPLPRGPF